MSGMDYPQVRVIEVIEVQTTRGSGKDALDPVRVIFGYYDPKTGELLAERDTWTVDARNPMAAGHRP